MVVGIGVIFVFGYLWGILVMMMEYVYFDDVLVEVLVELGVFVVWVWVCGCCDVWVDFGIGFGKCFEYNVVLL